MKQLAKWFTNILLILVVLVAVFALLLPSIFSSGLAIVYSRSMEPAMPMGSLALMSLVDPATIEVGDIIAFHPPSCRDVVVSHRVIEVIKGEPLSFRTKGDANDAPDPDILTAESIVGRVTGHVPHVGFSIDKIREFTRTAWGLGFLIALPAVIIFSSAVRDVNFMYSPGRRRARLQKKREEHLKKRAPRNWQLRRTR